MVGGVEDIRGKSPKASALLKCFAGNEAESGRFLFCEASFCKALI